MLRIRRANHGDVAAVENLLGAERHIQEKRWGSIDIERLIELSPFCFIGEDNGSMVAFCSLCYYPTFSLPGTATFNDWFASKYPDSLDTLPSSLVVSIFFGDALSVNDALSQFVKLCFIMRSNLEAVYTFMPDGVSLPPPFQASKFQMLQAATSDAAPNAFVIYREEVLAPIIVRPARVEDHDDLMPVFNAQVPEAKELGEFFVAQLIQSQDHHNRALVAEAQGRAVGLLCITKDVDLSALHRSFDLETYDFLTKGYEEEVERVHSLHLLAEEARIAQHNENQAILRSECVLQVQSEVAAAIQFREEALARQKAAVDAAQLAGADMDAAAESVPIPDAPDTSIEDLVARRFVEVEFVPQNCPGVDLSRLLSNSMCVTLFFVEDAFQAGVRSLLDAAFQIFDDVEYCLSTLAYGTSSNALTDLFDMVAPLPGAHFSHCLYVFHSAALAWNISVQELKPGTLSALTNLVEGVAGSEQLHQISTSSEIPADQRCFSATVADVAVGAMLVQQSSLGKYSRHFNVSSLVNPKYHNSCADVIEMVMNPIFVHSTAFVVREVAKKLGVSLLFHRIATQKSQQPLAVWRNFCFVQPRCVPKLQPPSDCPPEETGLVAPVDDPACSALLLTTERIIDQPTQNVSSRIVIAGCSDAGMSLILSLLSATQFRFSSITLVSPGGLHEESKVNLFQQSLAFYSQELSRVAISRRISVVDDKLVSISRNDQQVTLKSGAVMPYDVIVLTTGLQDGNLDRLLPVDSSVEGAYAPHSLVSQADAEKHINTVILKDRTSRVVITGSRIDVLSAVHYLVSLGVHGSRITVALANALTDVASDENLLGKMAVEFARAGITLIEKCTLASVETSKGSVVAVTLKGSDDEVTRHSCRLVLSYGQPVIDDLLFRAVNGASLVLDGKVVVDGSFSTHDHRIIAGGCGAKFARRIADNRELRKFSGKELGARLLSSVLFACGVEMNKPDGKKCKEFTSPVGKCCVLPGNLQYISVEVCDLPIGLDPKHTAESKGVASIAGRSLTTDTFTSGYCRIDLDFYGRVARLIVLTHVHFDEPQRFLSFAGVPASALNSLVSRFDNGQIPDLLHFIQQPWAHALMHDLYPQLYVQHSCAAFHLRILMQRPQIFKYNGAVRRRRGAAAGCQGAP